MTDFITDISSPRTKKLILDAYQEAISRNHECIEPEHFLLGILKLNDPELTTILKTNKIDSGFIEAIIIETLKRRQIRSVSELPFSKRAMKMLLSAKEAYFTNGEKKLEPGHILSVILANKRQYIKRTRK